MFGFDENLKLFGYVVYRVWFLVDWVCNNFVIKYLVENGDMY